MKSNIRDILKTIFEDNKSVNVFTSDEVKDILRMYNLPGFYEDKKIKNIETLDKLLEEKNIDYSTPYFLLLENSYNGNYNKKILEFYKKVKDNNGILCIFDMYEMLYADKDFKELEKFELLTEYDLYGIIINNILNNTISEADIDDIELLMYKLTRFSDNCQIVHGYTQISELKDNLEVYDIIYENIINGDCFSPPLKNDYIIVIDELDININYIKEILNISKKININVSLLVDKSQSYIFYKELNEVN